MSIIQSTEDFVRKNLEQETINHTLRVRQIALKLAETEEVDKEIVELAALLHDIGYMKGFKDHAKSGVPITREFLTKQSYDPMKIGKIINCITKHSGKETPQTTEEKIIWDSDCLDRIGAIGILRMSPKFVKYNLCKEEELPEVLKTKLNSDADKLHTETAKKFAKQLVDYQNKFFKELQKQLDIINGDFDFFYKITKED
ncbi:HD domain-containing protein [Candidatus Woesearchaeota archaeon]|nr:HD domain-containing protein [Candidatus Woesearchaeota archaeon]